MPLGHIPFQTCYVSSEGKRKQAKMQLTAAHAQIVFLEGRIQTFKTQLSDPGCPLAEREWITSSLHLAELALAYYRQALQKEQSIPPHTPGELPC